MLQFTRRQRYKKSPSFLSIHMGVRTEALPPGTQCHHIIVEDWGAMEAPHGTLFVSIPTLLDPSLSPDGTHIVHIFTPDWIESWQVQAPPSGMDGGLANSL
jgi:prolycopene isomerase